ncbi:MAG: class I SAM-dependent methyltransferase [Turneriella sp.]|nr:class I SAM-dependent methyltransferase [Turneriella sp.]
MTCPICGESLRALDNPAFAVCPNEKLVVNLAYQTVRYESDYFDKEYKQQYGKSYTADRQAILERNQHRYDRVRHLFGPATHPQVLEIGSAAGYFLKAMQDEEFVVRGWEISKTMAAYANARGLKTTRQDFLKGARAHAQKQKKPYDVVAMFYVLEHLPDQQEVWQHLARLVRPGGFLLLALPSAAGPTFRFHRNDWYKTHPADHAVDYSPAAIKRVGARFGFAVSAIFSEGIHPQRFPLGHIGFLNRLYRKAASHAPLSDTIFAALEKKA